MAFVSVYPSDQASVECLTQLNSLRLKLDTLNTQASHQAALIRSLSEELQMYRSQGALPSTSLTPTVPSSATQPSHQTTPPTTPSATSPPSSAQSTTNPNSSNDSPLTPVAIGDHVWTPTSPAPPRSSAVSDVVYKIPFKSTSPLTAPNSVDRARAPPGTAVVLFCFNRPEELRRTLKSILATRKGQGWPLFISQQDANPAVSKVRLLILSLLLEWMKCIDSFSSFVLVLAFNITISSMPSSFTFVGYI